MNILGGGRPLSVLPSPFGALPCSVALSRCTGFSGKRNAEVGCATFRLFLLSCKDSNPVLNEDEDDVEVEDDEEDDDDVLLVVVFFVFFRLFCEAGVLSFSSVSLRFELSLPYICMRSKSISDSSSLSDDDDDDDDDDMLLFFLLLLCCCCFRIVESLVFGGGGELRVMSC